MRPRIYFDTSVFGGVFDEEFQEDTLKLFKMVLDGHIICVFSDLTLSELENAPQKVKTYFSDLPYEVIEKVEVTKNSSLLANKYLDSNVVGKTSYDDCLHIATATLSNVEFLLSWNFKHIVNVFRIRGYNSINIREGYHQLEIRSPKDIIDYGSED